MSNDTMAHCIGSVHRALPMAMVGHVTGKQRVFLLADSRISPRPERLQLWWRALLAVLLIWPLASQAAMDPDPETVARQVKAAYLYKFANYVEWPNGVFESANSPIVIGVIGDDPLAAELTNRVAGKTVNGRPFAVRQLRRNAALDKVHVLFLGQMDRKSQSTLLAASKGRPVLVVSDSPQAYALGSMVNFVMIDQRLRFEVALAPVARNRLKLSALMLTAAYNVAREGS